MGISTDAILYYGYELNALDDYDGEPEWLHKPKAIPEDDWEADLMGELDAWLDNQGIKDVEIDSHCHCDAPYYYLHIPALQFRARRGQSVAVPSLPDPSQKALEQLERAADALGAPEEIKQTRGWHLVSYADF